MVGYMSLPLWNCVGRLGISNGWVYVLTPLELCGEVRDSLWLGICPSPFGIVWGG